MWAARAHAGSRAPRNARPRRIWCFPIAASTCATRPADDAVAEANQVLFFNAGEGYRVSHPVAGGDASLTWSSSEPLLRELAPEGAAARTSRAGVSSAAPAHRSARAGAGRVAAAQPAREGRRDPGGGDPGADAGAARAGDRARRTRPAPVRDGASWSIAPSSCSRAIWRGAGRWPRSRRRSAARRSI